MTRDDVRSHYELHAEASELRRKAQSHDNQASVLPTAMERTIKAHKTMAQLLRALAEALENT